MTRLGMAIKERWKRLADEWRGGEHARRKQNRKDEHGSCGQQNKNRKGGTVMKLKYICRFASLVVAGLLLIIVGNKIPKEKEEWS